MKALLIITQAGVCDSCAWIPVDKLLSVWKPWYSIYGVADMSDDMTVIPGSLIII